MAYKTHAARMAYQRAWRLKKKVVKPNFYAHLLNKKFGRITVASDSYRKNNATFVLVICDCGNEKEVNVRSVMRGLTKSCGCIQKEHAVKHGKRFRKYSEELVSSELYKKWQNIKCRCYSKGTRSYKDYGGRGIIVCDKWRNDFMAFYNWAMANSWQAGLEIDRRNNDGNYEPENCRWVTRKENVRNRRTAKLNQGKVDEIRSSEKSNQEVAIEFHISERHVKDVRQFKRWT